MYSAYGIGDESVNRPARSHPVADFCRRHVDATRWNERRALLEQRADVTARRVRALLIRSRRPTGSAFTRIGTTREHGERCQIQNGLWVTPLREASTNTSAPTRK